MSKTARILQDGNQVIDLMKMRRQIEHLIRPHLFRHVRLVTAVWHTLAIAKNPLTPNEVLEAMERGNVITTALKFGLINVERALKYHTKVGKLRYVGHEHYTIK